MTSSKDYRVWLFYSVFAVLLYNIWRFIDFLLKSSVDGEMNYAPVLTTDEICSEVEKQSAQLTPSGPTYF
jgi:IS4 transposase